MNVIRFLTCCFFLLPIGTYAQQEIAFGTIIPAERALTVYQQDTTASAVVLYEKGDNFFEIIKNRIKLVKEYHVKIKVLKKEGFSKSTVSIPYYRNSKVAEVVTHIKGITHNTEKQSVLDPKNVFDSDMTERWSEKKFTLPNVKVGSILEYTYRIESPFIFNFNGWDFQSDIPKIYSEFNAKIPSNYKYNRALSGSLELDVNDAKLLKDCFYVPGYSNPADCEILKYSMKDIPAFKADERFMLSPSNYISRLDFEMSEIYNFNGTRDQYTKSWNDVDKEFKHDTDIGRQLTKKGFFEKNVPKTLFETADPLQAAKNIYAFVQDHYSWNEKYSIYRDNNVKQAFEKRSGNVAEINMSLINLLNAANIKANLVMLSTRKNGLPKKSHPVMSDFNYVIAKVDIGDETYLLDATDKFIPFGMLPYRCLNYDGRVMDFKKESYWYAIKAPENSQQIYRVLLNFNEETGRGFGRLNETTTGYDAIEKRSQIAAVSEEQYLEERENTFGENFQINSYEFNTEKSNLERIVETYAFEIDDFLESKTVYLNPFLVKFFTKNPFLLENRSYPIDFGYTRSYKYRVIINVPASYEIVETPSQKFISLPENIGRLVLTPNVQKNMISLNFEISLKRTQYPANYYRALQELFKNAVDIQKNTLIVLKKK